MTACSHQWLQGRCGVCGAYRANEARVAEQWHRVEAIGRMDPREAAMHRRRGLARSRSTRMGVPNRRGK